MVILMSLFLLLITGSPFASKYKNRSLTNHTKNSLPFLRQGNLPGCAKTFRRYERFFCLSRSYLTEITLPLIRFPLSGRLIFCHYRRIHRHIQGRTWADWQDPPATSRTYRSGNAVHPRAFLRRSSGRMSPCSPCRRYRSSPRNSPAWESRTRDRIFL